MDDKPNSQAARDIAYYFHPATNARRHEEIGPTIMERGKGVHVYDDQGKEYIEGLAGLWSVAVGFGEERLVKAATRQMQKLPYYHSFNHKSHPAAIDLAERLVKIAPKGLAKVQFTSSGSEANDFAIKLLWYYNNAVGRPQKKKFISRQRAYHGVTIAAASLTGLPVNQRDFDLPLPMMKHVSTPHYWRNAQPGESEEAFATRLAEELDEMIRNEGPDTVAAFVGEPVMGAGGVIVPPKGYWEKIQAVCRKHDVMVIADEVICGFGRTGKMFACELYGIKPDILVLSKAITSSYMPLSAVLVSDKIYQAIADNSAKIGSFGHGFTASGHPVATAVALENLDIFEERDLVGHAARVSPRFLKRLHSFASRPLVGETRGVGLVGAIELVANKETKAPFAKPGTVGPRLQDLAQEEGLVIRGIGEIMAFCPPLIITEAEIDEMFARFDRAMTRLENEMGVK
ncbi:MAG: aspartate aminotransferase family protein [Hyphomicrobiales bacterium]|nr:aspartate aminotransferase family protein [Hyphomicrobiales bacterium]